MKSIRSITLRTRKVLAVWLLLSLSATQVFAMSMDSMPMEAEQKQHCDMTLNADSMMQHDMPASAMASCADMSSQDCNPDHCVSFSAMTLNSFSIVLPIPASTVTSINVSADSIDSHPPYHPPITH